MPFAQPALHIAWRDKPATYFVCTEDLAMPAELQRQRATPSARLIEFPSGHHPFLSHPEAFAQSIAAEIPSVT
jgi:pimeloyl-ACP methyl ester carboxylesterase